MATLVLVFKYFRQKEQNQNPFHTEDSGNLWIHFHSTPSQGTGKVKQRRWFSDGRRV